MPEPQKYGIDCQICPHSLTIVHTSTHKDPEKVKTHLAKLMLLHLKMHEKRNKIPSEKTVKSWVVKLKPRGRLP